MFAAGAVERWALSHSSEQWAGPRQPRGDGRATAVAIRVSVSNGRWGPFAPDPSGITIDGDVLGSWLDVPHSFPRLPALADGRTIHLAAHQLYVFYRNFRRDDHRPTSCSPRLYLLPYQGF